MASESDLRGSIRDWLVRNDITPREEYPLGGGRADLYLGGYRVVIEVKTERALRGDPHEPKPSPRGEAETPFQQVSRYVEADRRREQTRLDEDRDAGWVGCVTDSARWWVWEYPADGGNPTRFLHFNGIEPTGQDKAALLDRFRRGTQWAPPNPYRLFEPALRDLKKLYVQRKASRETGIQKQLWLEQLRASGQPPGDDAADDLFVRHTLLILVSRLVGGADDAAVGFVQWVPEDAGALENLRNVVRSYDWRNETGDILRSLYMDVINPKSRAAFGEFYTPDWLAEKLCSDTIDDDFIQEQLNNHAAGKPVYGVLDPACGSGTFLYHAARRILNSKPLQASYLNMDRKREFVLHMIHGLDIHPVAVEMARANMSRIFPGAPSDSIRIHQGDSLLITRPDTGLHAIEKNSLVIFTPKNSHFMIPNGFLDDAEGIRTFVLSARDDADMPPGLGRDLPASEREALRENHRALRGVIRREGNGVWAWYIMNQASPLLLRRNKVGRIVSNPPWVRYNRIYDKIRKGEVHQLAKDLKLWIGGRVSTSFDVSQLFVVRCSELYLREGGWSSWVLPHGALFGDAWRKFREEFSGLTARWHLGRLPFPNTPSCALFFGPPQKSGKMVKTQRGRPDPSVRWADVADIVEMGPLPEFPEEASAWVDKKGSPLARNGATLVPHCMVKVDTFREDGNGFRVTTVPSMHRPWSTLGTMSGHVPREWLYRCVHFADVMPFCIPTTTPCVLPIADGAWDPGRSGNDFYRLAFDNYGAHRGMGKSTPRSLEGQYNYHNKLFAQLKRTGPQVVYNAAGDNLYAARMMYPRIIDTGLFAVPCDSQDEALFLTAILNAPALLEAFRAARQSDRDFLSHVWRKVPVPRYDEFNDEHKRLIGLANRAERIAEAAWDPDATPIKNRGNVARALTKRGIYRSVDGVVRMLFPRHAT